MDKEKEKEIEALVDQKLRDGKPSPPIESHDHELVPGNPFDKRVAPLQNEPAPVHVEPPKDLPKEMVGEVHIKGMEAIIRDDQGTQAAILKQSKNSIENQIEQLKQKSAKQTQDVVYDANQEACQNFGIAESVPRWQIWLMRRGSDFWFIIYFVVAFFTIAPVMIFFRGIKTFVKKLWLALLLAIIVWAILYVGIPLLIHYLNAIQGGILPWP
ncbi:MAG: hypothetical protein A2Y16_05335 [Tenericutes bacterium GWF2_57_13]|nr:MAG: hypothetical protein A2Y16_05335 [Tenericutes bacterium GWF2_57_13]